MTPQEFTAKWRRANLSERSACQQHFLDLCDLLAQPKPAAEDPEGTWYTFERGVTKTEGGHGWADVWLRGHFGWEYKGKHKDLAAAYKQLLLYREDLENPPLLVVCDLDRFEIHTNFTGTVKRVYTFSLDDLAQPANLDVLRKLFTDPEALRPGETTAAVTEDAARHFASIADGMRSRGIEAHVAAHFIMKLMFCMFGEDIALLPEKVFSSTLDGSKRDPKRLAARLQALFDAMAAGGDYGPVSIPWFNGGLFRENEPVVELSELEIDQVRLVNQHDWSSVEPSIFGTLFERSLDPGKRSQIGAHYTSRDDILTLLEPVVMAPLRRQWSDVRAKCDVLWGKIRTAQPAGGKRPPTKDSKERRAHDKALRDFVEHLAQQTILDPACGSGNFLYVAINLLLDLEKEVIAYAATHGTSLLPQVRPTQLSGLEINPYAQELAQVVIWIGYLQWKHHNGFQAPRDPILEPIESIRLTDAILDLSDPEHPKEPEWPEADFIVGNPPFLGGKLLRPGLGDPYVEALHTVWSDRLPKESDLCCYWLEKARQQVERGRTGRGGLLATQGIRGGSNRETLKRILRNGQIFFAESDRPWILDGANVHISMVAFDDGSELSIVLDGENVPAINANLTAATDVTQAKRLISNAGLYVRAPEKGGKFELTDAQALEMLCQPNPNGLPNSDVIRPWVNAKSLVQVPRPQWIVDFPQVEESIASRYEQPFAHVEKCVRTFRRGNSDPRVREKWWLYRRPGDGVREAQDHHRRLLISPMVSKHRIFAWVPSVIQPDKTTIPFARSDDYFIGVLHSRLHELWGLRLGTRLETRPRYTPTTCFETFPFPEPTDVQREAIAEAARELDTLRNNWLNPPEWTREEVLTFPGSVDGPWARYVHEPRAAGIGTVRYPRLAPRDEDCAKQLAKRTLTNLYNQRPTWLDLAHQKLDAAVFAAYGWDPGLSDDALLEKLLALNLARSAAEVAAAPART